MIFFKLVSAPNVDCPRNSVSLDLKVRKEKEGKEYGISPLI